MMARRAGAWLGKLECDRGLIGWDRVFADHVRVGHEHGCATVAIGEIPACKEEACAEAVAIRIVHAADGVARREEFRHRSDAERALAEKVLFVLSRMVLEGGADFRHAVRIDAPVPCVRAS